MCCACDAGGQDPTPGRAQLLVKKINRSHFFCSSPITWRIDDEKNEFSHAFSLITYASPSELPNLWQTVYWIKWWATIPAVTSPEMMNYLGGADPEGAKRATKAMLKMKKINLAEMKRAYLGQGRLSLVE